MWRVNTSSTQARQIHFSSSVTDSTGSADRSSGSIPTAGLERGPIFAPAAFPLDEPVVLAALSRAGFADLDAGVGFRVSRFARVFEAGLVRRAGIRTPRSTLQRIAICPSKPVGAVRTVSTAAETTADW